mgnify:CR=1 FL=1
MNVYEELQQAILKNDEKEINRLKHRILTGRDDTLDRAMYENIKKKTLGREIRNIINKDLDTLDAMDCMTTCTSLITHNIIEACINDRDLDDYPVSELYVALGAFINRGPEDGKVAVKRLVEDRYKWFI